MAIRVAGFSNLGSTGLRKTLDLLVSRQSAKIIQEHAKLMYKQLQMAAKEWQALVREKLSQPVKGDYFKGTYIRNTSLWPRMQQGRLVKAILKPKVSYSEAHRGQRRNQIRFKVENFYGPRVETIGVLLDEMVETNPAYSNIGGKKPFAGWLVRANREWDRLLEQRGIGSGARFLRRQMKGK